MPKKSSRTPINNLVVVSDTHSGCRLALCPPEGVELDDGGTYQPSKLQRKLWGMWENFWGEFVPDATKGEPFAVVHNGDAIDGKHHDTVTQVSQNIDDQVETAYQILSPLVDKCDGRYMHIRGTEAHVGKSAQAEEGLARRLGAIPTQEGQYARWDLWTEVGNGLVHLLHHIGVTGSQAYESTAIHKELVEMLIEAARWGRRPPDMVVRSHRHRHAHTGIAGRSGEHRAVVTPGWQGKTPLAWRVAGARVSTPQFGGIVIRYAHGRLFFDPRIYDVEPSPVERVYVSANYRGRNHR